MVTHDPPKPGTAHICKRCNGYYYWVPVNYQGLFFKLALLTTAQRGKPLDAPDSFFSVVVQKIEGVPKEGQLLPNGTSKNKRVTVLLDKKIPNDIGYLVFDGEPVQYDVRIDPSKPGGNLSESEFATVVVGNDVLANFKTGLPKKARIFLDHRQPKAPTTDDMLNKVNFQLQQIQFNQLRQP